MGDSRWKPPDEEDRRRKGTQLEKGNRRMKAAVPLKQPPTKPLKQRATRRAERGRLSMETAAPDEEERRRRTRKTLDENGDSEKMGETEKKKSLSRENGW
ncbi:unnamed protein product [Linum trigynum]|uniref:Uncharacterized protein n=1 Tax=Linum trigynum TaxID=586398 RepID=A0AAV2GLV6_9ROSI